MDEFLNNYPAGSRIDTDGFPSDQPFQCFDAAMVYMRQIARDNNLYIRCQSSGYVKDLWNDFDSNGLSQWFDQIPWNQQGLYGDIIIYGNAPATPYSHVAMLIEDKGTVQRIYGQNQPYPYTTITDFTSNGILGYLRPKQQGDTGMDTIKSMYWRLLGRGADDGEVNSYLQTAKNNGWEFVYNDIKNSPEGQADWMRRNPERVAELEQNEADIIAARSELAATKNDLSVAITQRDILKTTNQSQEQTILELQKQIDSNQGGGIQPTPPVDYSWVMKLQEWLKGIFTK